MLRKVFVLLYFLLVCCYGQQGEKLPRPDYRNGINLPSYDEIQFPHGTIKTEKGTWTQLNPKVPFADYIGLKFHGKDTGWCVGIYGCTMRTTDKGENWEYFAGGTSNTLMGVDSYDGKTVIASGNNGTIIRSTNAGQSWTQINTGATNHLWKIQMLNDTLGWACGKNAGLLKTTNGGIDWLPVATGYPDHHYWSLEFCNTRTGYIACSDGYVLKTTNGGQSWVRKYCGENSQWFWISVLDTLRFAVAGYKTYARIGYSEDGGNTFTFSGTYYYYYNQIKCVTDSVWVVTSNDPQYAVTTNRGSTWSSFYTGYGENYGIAIVDSSTMYVCGNGLSIDKSTNRGISWEKLIINDSFEDIYIFRNGKGFVTGGALCETRDGGETWKRIKGVSGRCITFSDSLNGAIGGYNPKSMRYTTDGGLTWFYGAVHNYADTVYGGNPITQIQMLTPKTGYAAGYTGVLKTRDGGKNWYPLIDNISRVYGVCALDTLNIWSVGYAILSTSNGGEKWERYVVNNHQVGVGVYFKNPQVGWIINYDRRITKTTDGGLTWTWLPVDVPGSVDFMRWLNGNTCVATSSGSIMYKTTDAGYTWETIPMPKALRTLFPVSPREVWGVTGGGLVLRYQEYTELTGLKTSTKKNNLFISNYPNPFNAKTKIIFLNAEAGTVVLNIFNSLGILITTLLDEHHNAGTHTVDFDAAQLPSGVYFYQLKVKDKSITRPMIVIK